MESLRCTLFHGFDTLGSPLEGRRVPWLRRGICPLANPYELWYDNLPSTTTHRPVMFKLRYGMHNLSTVTILYSSTILFCLLLLCLLHHFRMTGAATQLISSYLPSVALLEFCEHYYWVYKSMQWCFNLFILQFYWAISHVQWCFFTSYYTTRGSRHMAWCFITKQAHAFASYYTMMIVILACLCQ
jgi:hypothetical protein